jgi:hypothetical protein
MSKGPCRFKQTDVSRAYKAAVAVGMRDPQIEIDLKRQKITVRSGAPEQGDTAGDAGNPWDSVLDADQKRAS